mgnify:CR=1 FL=1
MNVEKLIAILKMFPQNAEIYEEKQGHFKSPDEIRLEKCATGNPGFGSINGEWSIHFKLSVIQKSRSFSLPSIWNSYGATGSLRQD